MKRSTKKTKTDQTAPDPQTNASARTRTGTSALPHPLNLKTDPPERTESLLTKSRIGLLLLSMNLLDDQPAPPPSFDIIVVGGTDAEIDELALTQRCHPCEPAVVLHIELERKKTDQ